MLNEKTLKTDLHDGSYGAEIVEFWGAGCVEFVGLAV